MAGDSATGRTKPATLETGTQMQVPLFINQGERIKVDTRDSSYLGRVKSLRPAPGARTKARKRALDVLFSAELREEDAVVLLDRARRGGAPDNPYTADLVRGVGEHRERIDELISAVLRRAGPSTRMPAVDRNVLRLGVWELLWADDVPDAVAVSEAMALVRELSTDESPSFVNGAPRGHASATEASLLA